MPRPARNGRANAYEADSLPRRVAKADIPSKFWKSWRQSRWRQSPIWLRNAPVASSANPSAKIDSKD